jgi:hypothetical protein
MTEHLGVCAIVVFNLGLFLNARSAFQVGRREYLTLEYFNWYDPNFNWYDPNLCIHLISLTKLSK